MNRDGGGYELVINPAAKRASPDGANVLHAPSREAARRRSP